MDPILITMVILVVIILIQTKDDRTYSIYAQEEKNMTLPVNNNPLDSEPKLWDSNLKAELIARGLEYPTTMAFLGQNDILILEKDKGTIKRILNGKVLERPLLDVNVSGYGEDGLVGISVANDSKMRSPLYVYLYYTESDIASDYYFFNYSLDVSAKDVNQLHLKVYYYDSNKVEINWEDYIFGGTDGTFEDTFTYGSILPVKAEYLKLQLWVRQSLKPSSYLIDSIKIDNSSLERVYWINEDKDTLSISTKSDEPLYGNSSLRVNIRPATSGQAVDNSSWSVITSDFIPLNDYGYYESSANKSGDITTKNKPLSNRLYRYEFVDNNLVNPKHLLDVPVSTYGLHNGGKIVIGPDNNVYFTVGDVASRTLGSYSETKAQNFENGSEADGRAGILRVTQNGEPVGEGILGNTHPLNLYFAYGIRNSFGIDFDPVTRNLWDTENGPDHGDEINLVEPGFNSGTDAVHGGMSSDYETLDSLVDFNGKGKYSNPEFTWNVPVGVTAIKFLNSEKYGKEYENDLFVGDFNFGNIYHFDLNKERTELSLEGILEDRIANDDDELKDIIFAEAPGAITDIQVGPDGYIYFVSLDVKVLDCDPEYPGCLNPSGIKGDIYRIVSKN